MPSTPTPPEPGAPAQPLRFSHTLLFRVRYSETDQMGTFYSSRALEWFECGRTELLRSLGMSYATLEDQGVFLPVVEAFVQYLGRARYDDQLRMTTTMSFAGRARLRCEAHVAQAQTGRDVARGHTVHAFTDPAGKVIRPPAWLLEKLAAAPRQA
jgi:acyl-CoA thioester hydrolase